MEAEIEELREGRGETVGESLASIAAEAIGPRCPPSREVGKEGGDLLGCEGRNIGARNEWLQHT
eukprot:7542883-Prorocentrum_lima.AAC.1